MKKNITRIIASFICGVYMSCSVSGAYVTAYSAVVPVTYTAWEIVQAILFTLGISVTFTEDVASSDLMNELAQEIVDTYNLWVNDLTSEIPEGYTTEDFMLDLADMGTWAKNGVISISDTVWQGLKQWGEEVVSSSYVTSGSFTLDRFAEVCNITDYNGLTNTVSTALSKCLSSGHIYCISNAAHSYFEFYSVIDATNYGLYLDGSTYYFANTETHNFPKTNLVGGTYFRLNVKSGLLKNLYIMNLDAHTGASGVYLDKTLESAMSKVVIFDNDIVDVTSDIPVYDSDKLAYDVVGLSNIDGIYCNDAFDIVTYGRTWDGTNVAGDVVISIPQTGVIDNAIAGEIAYEDVYEQIGAYPVDITNDIVIDGTMTIDEAIASIAEPEVSGGENANDTEINMTFDLSQVFPFCIPFDLIDFISVLSAEPVAPYFEIPIKYPTLDGMSTYMVKIDFAQFDSVASLVRKMECIVFIVGLLMITRDNMIKG